MALPALLVAAAVATFAVDPTTEGLVVEDHRAPVVDIAIEIPAGTWSPWVRTHHAEEAWTFQDDDPGRALRKRADALAASIDLDMGRRSASLRARCLKTDLAATLTLVKDILRNTRYDAVELKRARRERPIEWRANDTDVAFRMGQATARSLFAEGDPRRLAFEKPEPVDTDVAGLVATRDALIRTPGRVVGFAGDLTPDEARDAAVGLLPAPGAAAPSELSPRLQEMTPATSRPKEQRVAIRKLTQVYLSLWRDSLPWTDPRRPAFLVADHVLGGHFYSRLYVALRHESGDTYGAGTEEHGDVVPGAYAAATFTRSDNAQAIEAKLRAVLERFHSEGITEAERQGAISYLRGRRAFDEQSADQILGRFMTERRLGLAPGYVDDLVERASTMSLDEINAFIREFYDPVRFTMLRAVRE
jgi:zinc protease